MLLLAMNLQILQNATQLITNIIIMEEMEVQSTVPDTSQGVSFFSYFELLLAPALLNSHE